MTVDAEIAFSITQDSEGDVVIVEVRLPGGHIEVMAEVTFDDAARVITARGLHVQGGQGGAIGPNDLGPRRLIGIARAALERMDYDAIIIEGGVRTTGARPGRRPRPIRIERGRGPSEG